MVENESAGQEAAVIEMPDYGSHDLETGLEAQDIELIRWMPGLSPTERLRDVQRFAHGSRRIELARRTYPRGLPGS